MAMAVSNPCAAFSARHRLGDWGWSVMMALSLNLAFFLLLPHLTRQAAEKPRFGDVVPQVQVFQLKTRERPPEPKRETEPEPPKEPQQMPKPSSLATEREAADRLAWPFEINARLPGGPEDLALPPVQADPGALLGIAGDLFEIGELDSPLVVVSRMPPDYPPGAKRNGTEGWVTVQFIVNEQGRVEQVTIVKAQPQGIFDDSVLRCVKSWRFQPSTVQGRPVRVWAENTVRFELE